MPFGGKNIGKYIENLKVKWEKMFNKRQFVIAVSIEIKKKEIILRLPPEI